MSFTLKCKREKAGVNKKKHSEKKSLHFANEKNHRILPNEWKMREKGETHVKWVMNLTKKSKIYFLFYHLLFLTNKLSVFKFTLACFKFIKLLKKFNLKVF